MKEKLLLQHWEAPEASADGFCSKEDGFCIRENGFCIREGKKAVYDFPNTIDLRPFDEIAVSVRPVERADLWLTIVLYPLPSGRPEFIRSTRARIRIAPGTDTVIVPFTMFDHTELVRAHMRYISHMELEVKGGSSSADGGFPADGDSSADSGVPAEAGFPADSDVSVDSGVPADSLTVTEVVFKQAGDFHVSVPVTASKAAEAGEEVEYKILLENERSTDCYVTVSTHRLGREAMCFWYPDSVLVKAGETKTVTVKAVIPEQLPKGGYEKVILEWTPDGNGEQRQQTVLYAARRRPHPYLLHKQEGWAHLKSCLEQDGDLRAAFEKEYIETADAWTPPGVSSGKVYVYDNSSQYPFLCTAVAWKLTGNGAYFAKLLHYIEGLFDEEHGYFTTEGTYFIFTESQDEFRKGHFPEHRAGSAGWVQEAEFMIKLAYVYDLIYDEIDRESGLYGKMEQLMRSYMAFESWRLLDGDGNNFQLAEATASLFFACLLQDIPLMERFLAGTNGLYELVGSVFSDDGSYFEGASGYMRLALELMLENAVALENQDINFKDYMAEASHDKDVIHAPWAVRQDTAEDKKPFLGMSFGRWPNVERPVRRVRDYVDNLRRMLNPQGILFSANDSNEQSFVHIMQKAYYVYQNPAYLIHHEGGRTVNLLYGPHMVLPERLFDEAESFINTGNGFAVLREKGETLTQAVLKFGQHGGYHGHFDRLSLLSYMKDNTTFHNQEFAWFGYDSFLFKMWVQASVAHNMVVVDGRMQEPTPCECIYFADGPDFHAACAQGMARWSDPPYGGQTPYQLRFPEEKCEREGRDILPPPVPRGQGGIGEYSEPVFQRRLVVLLEGCVFVWDYLCAKREHTFDCLYHPFGVMQTKDFTHIRRTARYDENPYGAGQFVINCHWYEKQGTAQLSFRNERLRVNGNDAVDFVKQVELFRAYPQEGEIMVGRYPHGKDTFTDVEGCLTSDWGTSDCKKTVAFRSRGTEARFVTALEAGNQDGRLEGISCDSFESIRIQFKDGSRRRLTVTGMDNREEKKIAVRLEQES